MDSPLVLNVDEITLMLSEHVRHSRRVHEELGKKTDQFRQATKMLKSVHARLIRDLRLADEATLHECLKEVDSLAGQRKTNL